MFFIPDLTRRHLVPEIMDDPNLPEADHELALKGLRRINRLSGTVDYLASAILNVAGKRPKSHWSILDIGCANGENLIALRQKLAKHLSITAVGWDISPFAIDKARGLAQTYRLSADQVRFEIVDAMNLSAQIPRSDIVINSLFMHHFDETSVVSLLNHSAKLADVAVLADDLHRTRLGWLLAKLGCFVLSRSPVVHFDGPQSVRAAFTIEEITSLAHQAGLHEIKIAKHWPERYSLCWERPLGT
jgi:SAM-dependent methyltransferase